LTAEQFRRFLLTAAMCLVIGALGGLLAAELRSGPAARERFIPPREPARDFRLRDQDGRWTTLADARGDVVVLTFLYSTCWDLCPAQAAEIVEAVGQVGGAGGVQVYGVSVDPAGDTRERVQRWLADRGLDGGPVRFLIGSRRALAPVWADYGIVPIGASEEEAAAAAASADRLRGEGEPRPPAPYEPPVREPPPAARERFPDTTDSTYRGRPRHKAGLDFEHSAYVMLIDKRGEQRVGIPFEQLDADLLARDLRLLLQEP
jgi:protein SCO1